MSRLLSAATDVLERSLAAGGTSFDSLYVQINGESGYFERSLRAYVRGGMPCSRCGTEFLKVMSGGRSSTSCPSAKACEMNSKKDMLALRAALVAGEESGEPEEFDFEGSLSRRRKRNYPRANGYS